MKAILSFLISGALVVSGYAQTRNVLVGTNNAVVQPTNFWSADASNARTGLGLGTAATNPASAFQPSSSALTNLSANNGVNLTNIPVAGVVGALTTNGNGAGLTNLTGANITGTVALASNVTGTIAISNGGSGATTASGARTNFGLGNISTNTFQTTNTAVYINTNLVATNGVVFVTNIQSSYIESPYFFVGDSTNGIVFETTNVAAITRTNLGLGETNSVRFENVNVGGDFVLSNSAIYWGTNLIFEPETTTFETAVTFVQASATRGNLGLGWSALTNTNTAGFNASLYGSGTNPVLVNSGGAVVSPTNFWQVAPINTVLQNITNVVGNSTNAATNARLLFLYSLAPTVTNVTSTITLPTNGSTFGGDVATITHLGPTSSVTAIRALGASTNLITLNQSEESVRFIYRDNQWKFMDNISYIEPIFFSGTNAAQHAAESRTNLGLGWVALTNPQSSLYSGVATTFLGYSAELVPPSLTPSGYNILAYTNTNTLVVPANLLIGEDQTSGGPRNARSVTVNGSVKIQYPFSSPTTIYSNNSITATDDSSYTNVLVSFISNGIGFTNTTVSGTLTATGVVTTVTNLNVGGAINVTNKAETRTNLGIPLAALTNTTVTNFQKAIFYTNTAPSNIGGNLGTVAAWIDVVASNGVTYKIPVYTNIP